MDYLPEDFVINTDIDAKKAKIDKRIAELRNLRKRHTDLEKELNLCQRCIEDIETRELPDLLESIGWAEGSVLVTQAGNRVELKRKTKISILAAHKEEVLRWLDEHGEGGLIKRSVIVPFSRDEEEKAKALEMRLAKEFVGVEAEKDVHWQTFNSWFQSRVKANEPTPPSHTVSIQDDRIAKVS